MTKYWFHVVLLLSVGSLVMSEILYPGPGLVEIPWRDPTVLRDRRCWRNNIVPYMYVNHNDIPDILGHTETVLNAIDKFKKVTCLRYVYVSENSRYLPGYYTEFLVFNRTIDGWCRLSELRNVTSGVTYVVLTLHVACLKESIEHMMMHALGFLHEHQRSDRDCYVEVSPGEDNGNFDIVPQPRWEERYPYDKFSVLHYHSSYRLKSLLVVIDPNDDGRVSGRRKPLPTGRLIPERRQPVGSERLSDLDISKIRYKFCKDPHYCDIPSNTILCEKAEEFKKTKNCTSWRFTNPDQVLPPS